MDSNLKSSKFWLSVVIVVASSVLKGLGIIDDTTYQILTGVAGVGYPVSNIVDKRLGQGTK